MVASQQPDINRPLVVIVGPTASGKSMLAMQVACRFNGEIVCADSRTVYRGMDIGTAKPTKQDQAAIRHHLIDIVEPDVPFSAAQFKQLANEAIADITNRGKLPIMVGGTGLYIDAVVFDYRFGKPADRNMRRNLEQHTTQRLQAICRDKNINLPINSQNRRHLIRAIELGGSIQQTKRIRNNTIIVGITTEKAKLREQIEHRVETMVQGGIIKEVENIANKYGWGSEAMSGNIYRVFKGVVTGEKTLRAAKQEVIQSDNNLAKRQITWFKRNTYIIWGEPDKLITKIDQFVSQCK